MSAPSISPAAAAEVRFIAARRLSRIVASLGAVRFTPEILGPLSGIYQDTIGEAVPPDMAAMIDKLKGKD